MFPNDVNNTKQGLLIQTKLVERLIYSDLTKTFLCSIIFFERKYFYMEYKSKLMTLSATKSQESTATIDNVTCPPFQLIHSAFRVISVKILNVTLKY